MNRLSAVLAFGFALFAALFAVAATQAKIPDILFHHMACFRTYCEVGQPNDCQQFTYTATNNLPNSVGLLPGALFYLFAISTEWNTQGLILLKYLCCFMIAVGCHGYAVRQKVSLAVFAPLAGLAVVMALGFSALQIGPQLLATTLLVGLLILLNKLRNARGWLMKGLLLGCLLLTSAIWGNFQLWGLIGALLVGFFWLDQVCQNWQQVHSLPTSLNKSWIGLAACFITLLGLVMNPWGLGFFSAFWQLNGLGESGHLGILPIWSLEPRVFQWVFIASLMIAGYSIWQAPRWPVFESFSLALMAVLTIRSTELASFYIVVWLCLVAPLIETSKLAAWFKRHLQARETTVGIAAAAAGILMIGLIMQSRFWNPPLLIDKPNAVRQVNQVHYPGQVVQFLREKQFSGNLFVPPNLGSYLAWELHPQVRISLDSRPARAFPADVIEENNNFYQASANWQTIMQNPLHQAILVPTNQPVYRPLKRLSELDSRFEWKQVYADQNFAVFARVGSEVAQRISTDTR